MATFHTFLDAGNRWRWHLKANNGEIVADSGQGYASLSDVRDAARRVQNIAPAAEID